jgi:predicted NBD/HSP70 family sugar kinase
VCVPGLLSEDRTAVVRSVNVPGLDGVRLDELVTGALGSRPASLAVATDTHATAYDLYQSRRPRGRLFVLAIGTGVGAAVLDDGRPLWVDGDSPGHFGQMDVSLEGEPVVGPDGGAGSLEGYISAAALAARYGADPGAWLGSIRPDHAPMRALVRAVRIAHAMFRPHHVFLAGGIGIRLGPMCPALRAAAAHRLTSIARPDWTLSSGDSDFHAAQGVARLAVTSA